MKVTQIKTLGALPLTPQPTYSTEKVGGERRNSRRKQKNLFLGGVNYDYTNKKHLVPSRRHLL